MNGFGELCKNSWMNWVLKDVGALRIPQSRISAERNGMEIVINEIAKLPTIHPEIVLSTFHGDRAKADDEAYIGMLKRMVMNAISAELIKRNLVQFEVIDSFELNAVIVNARIDVLKPEAKE